MIRVFVLDMQPVVGAGVASLARAHDGLDVVGHAHELTAARKACAQAAPDVLVVDESIVQAGVHHWLTGLAESPGCPALVVFTARNQDCVVLHALRLNALAYVLKSEPPEVLFDAVLRAGRGATTFSTSIQNRLVFAPEGVQLVRPFHTRVAALSPRELVVVHELARGLSVKEVGTGLGISEKTVDNHKTRAMAKLGVRNRAGLVRSCYEEGILVVPPFVG